MSAPMKSFKQRSLIKAIRATFLEELSEPRAGLTLAVDHQEGTGDWGDRHFTWDELGEMESVQLSMELPPIRAEGTDWVTHEAESPIWTGDLKWGGRKWREFQNSWERRLQIARASPGGVGEVEPPQTKFIQKKAEAMLDEINNYVLFGGAANDPGQSTGLLNHTGVITITDAGNWLDPTTVIDDMNDGISQARDRRYRATEWALIFNPADMDRVVGALMPDGGGDRLGDHLPNNISRVLIDENVSAQRAYAVPDRNIEDAYAWVHPEDDPENGFSFGLGNVSAARVDNADDEALLNGTTQERQNEFWKTRVVRLLNIGSHVVRRTGTSRGTGSGVVEWQFSV